MGSSRRKKESAGKAEETHINTETNTFAHTEIHKSTTPETIIFMQKDYKEKKERKEESAQTKRYDKEPPKMPLSLFLCVSAGN